MRLWNLELYSSLPKLYGAICPVLYVPRAGRSGCLSQPFADCLRSQSGQRFIARYESGYTDRSGKNKHAERRDRIGQLAQKAADSNTVIESRKPSGRPCMGAIMHLRIRLHHKQV